MADLVYHNTLGTWINDQKLELASEDIKLWQLYLA